MRLKSIGVLRGYAMGRTQLSKIADNIEHEVEEALEFERSENAKLRDELAKWERLTDGIDLPEYPVVQFAPKDLERENAKLRELVRGLHMAYIGIIGKCESFDSSLTLEFSSDIDADLAKQHASYEQDRHRFDVAMRELGVGE